jgi:FAD/FMN-containing dehydrogenase
MFPEGRNYCWRSAFVEELTDDVLTRVIDQGDRAPTELCTVSVWPMDGSVQDVPAGSTAFPWRTHDYMLSVEANWEGPDATAHVEWARETDAAFRELGAEGAYAGFPGLGDTDEDVARLVYGDNYERIADLKSEYDPTNLFTETSNVPPAGG